MAKRILGFLKSFPYFPVIFQAWVILFCLIMVLNPYIQFYYFKRIPEETYVDPEYINGLLTVSSILFGFSSLLVFQQKEKHPRLFLLLFLPLIFITRSSGTIWDIVLGTKAPIHGLLSAWTSVLSSTAVTFFLAGFTSRVLEEKQ